MPPSTYHSRLVGEITHLLLNVSLPKQSLSKSLKRAYIATKTISAFYPLGIWEKDIIEK
jgi:hypothetical protein